MWFDGIGAFVGCKIALSFYLNMCPVVFVAGDSQCFKMSRSLLSIQVLCEFACVSHVWIWPFKPLSRNYEKHDKHNFQEKTKVFQQKQRCKYGPTIKTYVFFVEFRAPPLPTIQKHRRGSAARVWRISVTEQHTANQQNRKSEAWLLLAVSPYCCLSLLLSLLIAVTPSNCLSFMLSLLQAVSPSRQIDR